MKKIPLTQGKVALVDDEDYSYLNQYKWCAYKGGRHYYASTNIRVSNSKWRFAAMHRMVLHAPDDVGVDHINGDGLDNRKLNLRLCTHMENCRNGRLRSNNKTGFKGVSIVRKGYGKPYRTQIRLNNKVVHLGYYLNPKEAARAYDLAATKHHGKFALTNEMLGLL